MADMDSHTATMEETATVEETADAEQRLAHTLSVVLLRFAETSGYIVYPIPKQICLKTKLFVHSASVHPIGRALAVRFGDHPPSVACSFADWVHSPTDLISRKVSHVRLLMKK